MKSENGTFVFFVLLSGIACQSFGAIFVRLCGDVPPVMVATFRMLFSSALLLGYWALKGKKAGIMIPEKRVLLLCMLSGFFLAAHFVSWIYSLTLTTVASSVVLVNMNAIFVSLLAYVFFKEKPATGLMVAIITAFTGCLILTIYDKNFAGFALDRPGVFLGNTLALCGAFASSFYLLLGSWLRSQHTKQGAQNTTKKSINLITYITIVYTTAALLLVLLSLSTGTSFAGYQPISYFYLFLMAVFPQLIGHSCINWSLKHLQSSIVALSKMGEPIAAALLAYCIFEETVTMMQVVGIVIIFFSISYAMQNQNK